MMTEKLKKHKGWSYGQGLHEELTDWQISCQHDEENPANLLFSNLSSCVSDTIMQLE